MIFNPLRPDYAAWQVDKYSLMADFGRYSNFVNMPSDTI